jgi:hypothetical protein
MENVIFKLIGGELEIIDAITHVKRLNRKNPDANTDFFIKHRFEFSSES